MHQFGFGEGEGAVSVDQQVPIRGSDEDRRWMQAVLLLSLFDLQGCTPAQDVSHEAAVPGVQMLHDDQGCRKVGRQVSQNPAQGSQAARRSGQGHDIESRFREDRRETRCEVSRNNCVLLWLKT